MTLGWHWPILWQGQIWLLRIFYRKKWNFWFFRTVASLWPEIYWDNEDMWVLKVMVISWPFAQGHLHLKIKTGFSQKPPGPIQSQILYVSFQELGNENLLTRWWFNYQDGRPCPYMVKTLKKNLPLRNRWTDLYETWDVALMTPAHQISSYDDRRLILILRQGQIW